MNVDVLDGYLLLAFAAVAVESFERGLDDPRIALRPVIARPL